MYMHGFAGSPSCSDRRCLKNICNLVSDLHYQTTMAYVLNGNTCNLTFSSTMRGRASGVGFEQMSRDVTRSVSGASHLSGESRSEIQTGNDKDIG